MGILCIIWSYHVDNVWPNGRGHCIHNVFSRGFMTLLRNLCNSGPEVSISLSKRFTSDGCDYANIICPRSSGWWMRWLIFQHSFTSSIVSKKRKKYLCIFSTLKSHKSCWSYIVNIMAAVALVTWYYQPWYWPSSLGIFRPQLLSSESNTCIGHGTCWPLLGLPSWYPLTPF